MVPFLSEVFPVNMFGVAGLEKSRMALGHVQPQDKILLRNLRHRFTGNNDRAGAQRNSQDSAGDGRKHAAFSHLLLND